MSYEQANNDSLRPQTVATIKDELPQLAGTIIAEYQEAEQNRRFLEQPNAVSEHSPGWHEFGIIDHCIRSHDAYSSELPGLLAEWGVAEQAEVSLAEKIDGVAKGELLKPGLLLHDIGKFAVRAADDQPGKYSFAGHEVASGLIIGGSLVRNRLTSAGLSPAQIEYLAKCGALHYELGHVREAAKTSGAYDLSFTQSGAFKAAAKRIIDTHPDFGLEVSLLFLADNLSKVRTRLNVETDDQLEAHREQVAAAMAAEGRPELTKAVMQLPVNVAVGRECLKFYLNSSF